MSKEHTLTARERLRIHLREARRTTDSPIVEAQLAAALDAWEDLPPMHLQEGISVRDYAGHLTPPDTEWARRVGTQEMHNVSERAHNGPERSGEDQEGKQDQKRPQFVGHLSLEGGSLRPGPVGGTGTVRREFSPQRGLRVGLQLPGRPISGCAVRAHRVE